MKADDTRKDTMPVKPTFSRDSDLTGVSTAMSGTTHENSTVSELARIADELARLNRNLSVTCRDDTKIVGLAHLIADIGEEHARRA